MAAVSCMWLCRNERQVGEGAWGRHGRYLLTVAWLTSMPSLSSAPWMRGAPQSGFARLIWRISSRTSRFIPGRPRWRDRDRGEEPRLAVTVPPQDGHLMPQGDEFEFQRGATANPELEQGPEGGQKREHAD